MEPVSDARRADGLAAAEANRFAEAYRLLLPFAEAGDAEVQGVLGPLVAHGLYRFESLEQLDAATGSHADEATMLADRDRGACLLTAASAAGIGPASFNLAGLYVTGYGGGTWEERKAKAAELFALAHAQGFTAFGWLTNGPGPGQPYLDLMELHLVDGDQSPPPDWWPADPADTPGPPSEDGCRG